MPNSRSLRAVKPEPDGARAPRKLSIACGQRKPKGFTGIDLSGDADIKHDLFEFPWPIKTSSVQEIECQHFVEHIPHYRPGWDRDGWWLFFDELHRIMKKGAIANITHPYSRNDRAFWDPTHERFIHEVTWYYLDKDWRKAQGLDHYPVSADFEVVTISGALPDEIASRSDQQQQYARNFYFNVVADLAVVLKARK